MDKNLSIKTGMRFGRLVAVESAGYKEYGKNKKKFQQWKFRCDCGNEKIIPVNPVKSGSTKSCGCLNLDNITKMGKDSAHDLTGKRYGRLVALEPTDLRNADNRIVWNVQCDCGNVVQVSVKLLQMGGKLSCGCLHKETRKSYSDKENKESPFYGGSHVFGIRSDKIRIDNTSGIKGVHYQSTKNRWVAQITFKCKTYSLGSYLYKEDAAAIRKLAEQMNFEPFIKWWNELQEDVKRPDFDDSGLVALLKSRVRSDNTSGITGVTYDVSRNKWVAQIAINKKTYMLGRFDNKDDAIAIRKEAEKMPFEDFINWNKERKANNLSLPPSSPNKQGGIANE